MAMTRPTPQQLMDSIDWAATPDDAIGQTVLDAFILDMAQKLGMSTASDGLRAFVIAALPMKEAAKVTNIQYEKAFGKAAAGRFAEAGAIFRAAHLDGVARIISETLAKTAVKNRQRVRANGKKGAEASRLYSNEDRAAWVALAALPEFANHSKKRKAELIAKRLGLGKAAEETIRKAI